MLGVASICRSTGCRGNNFELTTPSRINCHPCLSLTEHETWIGSLSSHVHVFLFASQHNKLILQYPHSKKSSLSPSLNSFVAPFTTGLTWAHFELSSTLHHITGPLASWPRCSTRYNDRVPCLMDQAWPNELARAEVGNYGAKLNSFSPPAISHPCHTAYALDFI